VSQSTINKPEESHHELPLSSDVAGLVITLIVFFWIFFVTTSIQFSSWLVEQVFVILGTPWPSWAWFLTTLINGILLLIPLLPLAIFWRRSRFRVIFQSWTFAAGLMLIFAPTRIVQPPAVQIANILQIVFGLVALVLILVLLVLFGHKLSLFVAHSSTMIWIAVLTAAVISYPWLAWGALGSPLDTILNVLAALLFGFLSGLLLSVVLIKPFQMSSSSSRSTLFLVGLAASTSLLILAAGFGVTGTHLLLMICLPAAGWIVAFLGLAPEKGPTRERWLAVSLFVGLIVTAPMTLIDPDELTLILGMSTGELLSWAFRAAVLSMFLALAIATVMLLIPDLSTKRRQVYTLGALTAWIVGLLIYFLAGQPGFYGEQLFVVLNNKAEIASAATIENYDERRRFVYDNLVNTANQSQSSIQNILDRLGIRFTPYYLVNGLAVDAGPLVRIWLSTRPEVDRVLDNPILRPLPSPLEITTGPEPAPSEPTWNITSIGADRVWEELGVTGQGIIIGQSDSGVQGDHPDLLESYRGRDQGDDYNWFDPWNETVHPTDIGGHGTHTLGSIVGQRTGIAPGAQWIGCVNLARNLANPALYLDCLQFMLAPFPAGGDPFTDGDPTRSAHVLNNSWGCPELEGCDANVLLDAVRALRAAGIFVVVSAGNEGPGCDSVQNPLAIYDEVFSVGAIDQAGNLADFSSRGPVTVDASDRIKPDLVAPGVNILSTVPGDSFEYNQGTSMAGPHVTGVVALLWSANQALIGDIELTEDLLQSTAQPYTGDLPDCASSQETPNNGAGYGIVNAFAAVQKALNSRP
jgi:hypothetical protein